MCIFLSDPLLPTNRMVRILYEYLRYLEEHYTWPNYTGEI